VPTPDLTDIFYNGELTIKTAFRGIDVYMPFISFMSTYVNLRESLSGSILLDFNSY